MGKHHWFSDGDYTGERSAVDKVGTRVHFCYGDVAVALTEQFWDLEVAALRTSKASLSPQIDEFKRKGASEKINRSGGEAGIEKTIADAFSARELIVLLDSISDGNFL